MGAVIVIFIALTAVLALHHQQAISRRAYTSAEADLRFREGRKFAQQKRFLNIDPPSGLMVTADVVDDTPANATQLEKNYGKKIFERGPGEWTGLGNLKAADFAADHKFLRFKPNPHESALKVFDKRECTVVETDIPGYAVYAPHGQVNLQKVTAWANPTFGEPGQTLDAHSGVPVIIGAGQNIAISNLTYGEAHSSGGTVNITAGEGLGFVGPLPLIAYEGQIMTQAQTARDTLSGNCTTGDKSALFNGPDLDLLGIINLLTSGGAPTADTLTGLIGLRQAMGFPVPMIPTVQMLVPLLDFNIWFHMPFAPDIGEKAGGGSANVALNEKLTQQQTASNTVTTLTDARNSAAQARDAAQQAYNENPTTDNQNILTQKQNELATAEANLSAARSQLDALTAEVNNMLANMPESSIPQTRAEDPNKLTGLTGWNYGKAYEMMGNMVASLMTGNFDSKHWLDLISTRVRTVHFGREHNIPHFQFGSPFVAKATMTVPRGRTLAFNTSVEVQGDLWLQRGSVLRVQGDLTVKAPGAVPPGLAHVPSGRLFLEEGATLIVNGNLNAQGTRELGSVMVGGEPGEIHALTAAILCDGDVNLPFGVHSGSTLDDLVGIPQLSDGLRGFFEMAAPNVAKVAGPFHQRKPYFASYASSFHLVILPPVPPLMPPIPLPPVPTFLPNENILVFVARALSLGHSATLNASLGENLYTHSDWWPFGDGVVPMTTRLSPEAIAESIGNALELLASGQLDPAAIQALTDRVTTFGSTFLTTLMDWVITESKEKLVKVAVQLLPAPSALFGAVASLIPELESRETTAADQVFQDFVSDINTTVKGPAEALMGNLLDHTDLSDFNSYVREHSGLFVWAGRSINVSDSARLAAGWFVAGDSINCQAELTIGTLMANEGSVTARDVLYYPYFNQASLYQPLATPTNWLDRAMATNYGSAFDSGAAVAVGPPPVTHRVTCEGWSE